MSTLTRTANGNGTRSWSGTSLSSDWIWERRWSKSEDFSGRWLGHGKAT